MKKLFLGMVLTLFETDSFAGDWRMRKFDMNSDGFITVSELKELKCSVKLNLFERADLDNDGKLSSKEARKASSYILNRCKGRVA